MNLNYKESQIFVRMAAYLVLWKGRLVAAPAKGGFSVTYRGGYRNFFSNAKHGEISRWLFINAAFFFVAFAGWLFLESNSALALEQTVPSQPMISKPTSPKTASRRDQGLDLSKLNRKHTELVESELFSTKSLFPQPVIEVAPATPTAPALPFVFFGRIRLDGIETIFLAIDKQSFTAKLNDTLEGVYLVNRIEEDKIVFTYLPLKTKQILNIPHGE